MLDSRKRLLGGAVITVVGLGTALLFRKPPEEVRPVAWPSGFTEVQPSAPLVNPTPPEPVQPRLAGRIEALADGSASAAPLAGSMYQLPASASSTTASNATSSAAPADPFLRGGSGFSLPGANPAPAATQSSNDNQISSSSAATNPASEAAKPPTKVYKLEELTPLVSTNQATTSAPATFAEPAKLDPAQQSAAASLAASTEHSSGYRWSPNRSSATGPQAANDPLSLAERPSLLAPPPMSAPPSAAPPATYEMPRSDAAPTLAMPSSNFAPAPFLSSVPQPATQPVPGQPVASGMRHRIVDGDTLGTIARLYYGDEQRARELFEMNRNVLRDPELLPIGTELVIPGGSPNQFAPPAAPLMPASPMSQGVPPLLTPPALEQFGPRTLAVSNSNWRGAAEPAYVPAAPATPVALSPWDQQLANAAPLPQPAALNPLAAAPLVTPAPAPAGWPPVAAPTMPGNPAASPQVGWPPQPTATSAGWPTRTWNSTESALNWVGNKVMGTSAPAAPTATSRTYLVKPLETWETLAQRFYGDPRHAATLQSANQQIPAGSKIRPGSVINVPSMPL